MRGKHIEAITPVAHVIGDFKERHGHDSEGCICPVSRIPQVSKHASSLISVLGLGASAALPAKPPS